MKKIVFVLLFGVILTAGVFASPVHPDGLGIGVLWGGTTGTGGGFNNNVALSLKVPAVPVFWGISFGGLGGNSGFSIGVKGDYYLLGSELIPTLGWFLGVGAYVNMWFGNNAAIGFGGRIPIGLTWQPISIFELFGNLVGTLGTGIYTAGGGGIMGFRGGIGGEIGIRLWF